MYSSVCRCMRWVRRRLKLVSPGGKVGRCLSSCRMSENILGKPGGRSAVGVCTGRIIDFDRSLCQDSPVSTEVVRPYKGVSADERRALRREQLMEAGLDVLGSEGIAGLTMTEVCARAGLTERY